MRNMSKSSLFLFLLLFFVSWVSSVTASVSYDHKAITINGQRRILISGSIHYPRSTPEVSETPMWFTHCSFKIFINGCSIFFFLFRGFYHLWPVFYFVLGFLVTVDVAGSYTEGQRGRSGCHRNLRFLERT